MRAFNFWSSHFFIFLLFFDNDDVIVGDVGDIVTDDVATIPLRLNDRTISSAVRSAVIQPPANKERQKQLEKMRAERQYTITTPTTTPAAT